MFVGCFAVLLAMLVVRRLLRDHPGARRGAAEQLCSWLYDSRRAAWVLDYAIDLANDEEAKVGDEILLHATARPNRALLQDAAFTSRLIESKAGRRQADRLTDALDDEANLGPVADRVLELADRVLSGDDGVDGSSYPMSRYGEVQGLGALLARLVEECERTQDSETRVRALDAWDRLIEAHPFRAAVLLEEQTA